jgi:hypothetical protein
VLTNVLLNIDLPPLFHLGALLDLLSRGYMLVFNRMVVIAELAGRLW